MNERAGDGGYRADIDGLRAIAVLAVVLFHAKVPGFSGGYVGVDVFFVISGFLILRVLREDVAAGRGFWSFMERRARRLIPASVPVILVALALGAVLLLPSDFMALGRAIRSIALFVSNHHFLSRVNYFEVNAPSPLLHFWSLSVEWQFYLAFALAFIALVRWAPRAVEAVIVGAALVSFAGAVVLVATDAAPRAFFLALPRAWEFLLGAWLALGRLRPPGPALATAMRWTGFALIVASVAVLDGRSAFPGATALAPVLGAVLLLHAGPVPSRRDPLAKALVAPVAVWLGRVSYGFYLWHWPLLVYAETLDYLLPSWFRLPVVALSLALAALTYRFVEVPFRRRRALPSMRVGLVAGALVTALGAGAGTVILETRGLPQRFPEALRHAVAVDLDPFEGLDQSRCDRAPGAPGLPLCRIGDAARPGVDFVVWGDSHALASWRAHDAVGKAHGLAGVLVRSVDCSAFGVDEARRACDEQYRAALRFILETSGTRRLFLQAIWTLYGGEYLAEFLPRMAVETGRRDIELVLVHPVPKFRQAVPLLLLHQALFGRSDASLRFPVRDYLDRNAHVLSAFAAARQVAGGRVREIPLLALLCPDGECRGTDADGRTLYVHTGHPSRYAVQGMEGLFAPILAAPPL
jgi:peptidoglycan/LPS O-acetylase OafA/YrhL